VKKPVERKRQTLREWVENPQQPDEDARRAAMKVANVCVAIVAAFWLVIIIIILI
jgi:hypothetical protein